MSRIVLIVPLLTCLMCVAGCQKGTSNIAAVQGLILFNGIPARASITSQVVTESGAPNGRPSIGDTRPDGTFALDYADQKPGAIVGPQQVTISVFPHERAEGEFDFNQRFRPIKVVKFTRNVEAGKVNNWKFYLTF